MTLAVYDSRFGVQEDGREPQLPPERAAVDGELRAWVVAEVEAELRRGIELVLLVAFDVHQLDRLRARARHDHAGADRPLDAAHLELGLPK